MAQWCKGAMVQRRKGVDNQTLKSIFENID